MSQGSSGKCYLLTGCASGIGRHLTGQMLARGHSVVATDLAYDNLLKVAKDDQWPAPNLLCLALNVTDSSHWDQAIGSGIEKFSKLDGVLNIAGYLQASWVEEIQEKDIDLHFNVNVKGVILGTHKAAKIMKAQGFGHIVNIASMAALAPIPGLSLYSASKYAVRSFSLAAAQELRIHGVYVSVLCPDAVQTPMLDKQKTDARAAMTFSGPKNFLQVADISRVILDKVLVNRPMELALPRHRAWLARLGDRFPGLIARLLPMFEKKGRARQQSLETDPDRE